MRYKPTIYRNSWAMVAIALVLVATSYVMIFASPGHLVSSKVEVIERRAESLVFVLSSALLDAQMDSTSLANTISAAKMIDDLAYLLITDEEGRVLSALNEAGARRLGYYSFDTYEPKAGEALVVKTSHQIDDDDPSKGTVYIGISPTGIQEGIRLDKQYFSTMGFILFLIAAALLASIKGVKTVEQTSEKMREDQFAMALKKGSLEDEVFLHKKAEETLKQSEQRYKDVLEKTMKSTFKDLERQKGALEVEVEQKTIAQRILKRYADRLSSLNVIERAIVDELPIEQIAQCAIEQIETLLDVDRVSVVQIDENGEQATILYELGLDGDNPGSGSTAPISMFRSFDKGMFSISDLSKQTDRSPIEDVWMSSGIRRYYQVTLTAGERVAGALNVGRESALELSEDDLTTIQEVADLLSIALRQHRHKLDQIRHETELVAERDRAEEMARLKTAFLTNMSHEIRTPLSGIIGIAQILHEELPSEKREFTGLIQEAAQRLLLTINSVLDLSKLEANKESFYSQKLDISEVVNETVKTLLPLADKKDLELIVRAPSETTAMLDRSALEAIINNLVGNAIKFTDTGTVTVSVRAKKGKAIIEVEDSGVGISEDFLPFIFDEFRQEQEGLDHRPHQGSGLGLAITARLVKQMDGTIKVRSTQGEGSLLRVTFDSLSTSRASDRGSRGVKGAASKKAVASKSPSKGAASA